MSLRRNNPYEAQFKQSETMERFRRENKIKRGKPDPMESVYNVESESPLLGVNTGLGDSKYDKDLNWYSHVDENDPEGSINEYRAQKQSAWAHLGAGLSRTAVKAATETAKLPGIVVGLSMGISGQIEDGINGEDNTNFIDTVFNNAWIRGLDNINEEIKSEYLPVYVKKAVQDGDLGDKIMSSAFWATDGADGAGFALGMILPGAMLGKLGLGSKMIGAANRMDKARELFAGAERAEEFVKAANKIGATARNIDSAISIGYNTAAEAGAEATQAGKETRESEGKIVEGWKASGYLNTPEYQVEAKKYFESLDIKRRNGHLTIEEQNELISDPLKVQEAILHQRFENEVTSMQSSIFGRNVAILLGPNTLMHMQLFGRVGRTAEKIAEKGTVENVGRMSKILNSSIGKGVTKFGERAVKNTLSEGFFEEGLQTSTANQFKRYVAENRAEEIGFRDTIPDTFTEYAKMLGTTEGQVAIMLGGVIGTGMTSITAHGQAKKEAKIKNEITNRLSIPMNNLNNIFTISDIYKKDKQGAVIYKKDSQGNPTTDPEIDLVKSQEILRSLILTDEKLSKYKEAVDNGDNSYLDEQQSNAMFQLAKTAAYNGEKGLSLLKEQLEANKELTDIQEREKNNDGSKKTYQQIIDETMETAKFLQKQNDKFQDFSGTMIKLNDERLDNQEQAQKFRTTFLNELNSRYLNVQNKLRFNKAKLEKLSEKRKDAFEELGIDPLYDSTSESPSAKMKSGLVSNEEVLDKASKTKEAIDNNPLISTIEKEYAETLKEIEKNKKDISEVWNGNIVDYSFKEFVDDYLEVEEETSETSLQDHQGVIDTINSFEDKPSLIKYLESLDKKFRDNDFIQGVFQDRFSYIGEQDKIKEELKRVEELEAESQKFEEDELVGTDTTPETTENVIDNDNNNGLETSQTSNNKEVDENDEKFDKDPSKENNLDDSTNPLKVAKNQGAARVISTNQQTGKALIGLEDFVEFEKIPRDKTNDKVTFEVGDINPKDQTFTANAILDRIKKGEDLTEDEITYLAKYLPIKVTITNGKDSASSFIDSMTSKSSKIVEVETLPLRKSIIKALIANKGDFKSIEGKVAKQFTGTLKLGKQNSNILELDVFKQFKTIEEKIKYFKQNTVYVSNKGEVKYCSTDLVDETTSLSSSNRGEVFLKIPMINGKPFYLKLNTARLTEEKAQDVLSLIVLKSNLIKEKKDFTFEDLQEYIDNDLPFVKTEFEFIKRNNDSIDVNLDRLINFIIFSQNTNAKTKLTLNKDGSFTVGELIHKVNNILGVKGSKGYTYNTDELNNLSYGERAALVKYFEYKRHNVLITKDDTATFNNDDYINYLLGINSDYAILTTNAVVNEATFQGYSNIYLNQAVVDKNAKKVVPAEETEEVDLDNPEDLLASLTGNYGGIETETIKVEVPQQPEGEKVNELVSKTTNDLDSKIPKDDQISFATNALPKKGKIHFSEIATGLGNPLLHYLNKPENLNEKAKKIYDDLKNGGKLDNETILLNEDNKLMDATHRTMARLALGQTEFDYAVAKKEFWTKSYSETISESYHKAKQDGSNPELVKAVEDLLGKPQEVSPEIADVEKRRKEDIKKYDERDARSIESITPNNPNHPTFKVGMKRHVGDNVIVEKTNTDNWNGEGDGYTVITAIKSPAEFDSNGKMTKAAKIEEGIFNSKEEADTAVQATFEKVKNSAGKAQEKANAKYDAELEALKPKVSPVEDVVAPKLKREGNTVTTKDNEKFTFEIFDGINGKVEKVEDRQNKDKFSFTIRDEKGEQAGIITFWKDADGKFFSNNSFVKEAYRGKGLASALYDYAKELGVDIKPSKIQTEGGKALWEKMNRENGQEVSPVEDVVAPNKNNDLLKKIKDIESNLKGKIANLEKGDIPQAFIDYYNEIFDGGGNFFTKEDFFGKIRDRGLGTTFFESGDKLVERITNLDEYKDRIKSINIQEEKTVAPSKIKTIKSNNLQEVFKTADAKTKAKIVTVIAKQLGLMDKVNPKDMNSSFNELYSNLKDNESLEKEIEKICGI